MSTFAAWSHERIPTPTDAEKIVDDLSQSIAVLMRCATGPKDGKRALALPDLITLSAQACRQGLVTLLINDHHYTTDKAEELADREFRRAGLPSSSAETP